MKTIVYFEDGSIESTVWADDHVAAGIARYATEAERNDYLRRFEMWDHEAREVELAADSFGHEADPMNLGGI